MADGSERADSADGADDARGRHGTSRLDQDRAAARQARFGAGGRGAPAGRELARWLQYGGWRFLLAIGAILVITAVVFALSQRETAATAVPGIRPVATLATYLSTPQAGATAAPPATAIVAAAAPQIKLQVQGTGSDGLVLRSTPGQASELRKTLDDGAIVTVIGPDAAADGRVWRNIRDASGAEGWAAGDWLKPAP